jgi:glycosyltransferase involved in cell wall biosynthesis
MSLSRLRVSLVIPAYNEEAHIGECLEAIARQTVQPYEVIVVDNNSTDRTAAIAASYPFVRVLKEKQQGVAFARDRGFNAARGDIIGRLDADGRLAKDWIACVQHIFADPTIDAASGVVGYRDIAHPRWFNLSDRLVRQYISWKMSKVHESFLYGVNMAIRRTSWEKVRPYVCHERRLHEDLDLAAHMSALQQRVIFTTAMWATISPRQAAASPYAFLQYVWANTAVCKEHNMASLRYFNQVALAISCLYLPIHLMHKGYNPESQRFSLAYALQNTSKARVSPVSD